MATDGETETFDRGQTFDVWRCMRHGPEGKTEDCAAESTDALANGSSELGYQFGPKNNKP